jgi:hypothetical protein
MTHGIVAAPGRSGPDPFARPRRLLWLRRRLRLLLNRLQVAPKIELKPIVLFVVPRHTHMVLFHLLLHCYRCWSTQHQVDRFGDESDVVPLPALMAPGVPYRVLKGGGWRHQLLHLTLKARQITLLGHRKPTRKRLLMDEYGRSHLRTCILHFSSLISRIPPQNSDISA